MQLQNNMNYQIDAVYVNPNQIEHFYYIIF